MSWWSDPDAALGQFAPLLIALVGVGLALFATRTLLRLRARRISASFPLTHQLTMLLVTGVGVVIVILTMPISDSMRGQLLGLLGIGLTAVIAFSSTTFVANAMAGLMLRSVENFELGDWVRVGDQFGRVTERGLFHVELQTEDRDLSTLPNLYLVNNPVTVVRVSGTIVSATLSLGYDVEHERVEALLLQAAEASGLEDPFVRVLELGDFAVSYRVDGFLSEVRHLLSARSRLRVAILDAMHGADVEIVSPTFVNQRRLEPRARIVPDVAHGPAPNAEAATLEDRVFDKADARASDEEVRVERERLETEIAEREKLVASAGEEERARALAELERRRMRLEELEQRIASDEAERAGTPSK